jgi:ABC-type phosphate transport system permease subunit
VAAAVYLEEIAPRDRLTDLIEVNINNLAAVPSIVFGCWDWRCSSTFSVCPGQPPW